MSLEHDPARSGSSRGPADTVPKTMSVPEAGRLYFDLGRDASYQAAKRGDIPYIQVGRKKRVPIAAMEKKLERVK